MNELPIKGNDVLTKDEHLFAEELKKIVQVNLKRVYSAINYGQVYTNWCIGKRIVEQEQKGETRAEYGKRIIAIASKSLTEEYGSGYSITNIFISTAMEKCPKALKNATRVPSGRLWKVTQDTHSPGAARSVQRDTRARAQIIRISLKSA